MDQERLGDDHLILRGGGGLALFGNKYSDPKYAGNKKNLASNSKKINNLTLMHG